MSAAVDRDQLRSALARVKPAVAKQPPILSGVRIDTAAGTVTACDLDRRITATGLDMVGDDTVVVVPHGALANLIDRCPAGDVTLSHDGDTLEVSAGRITAHLRTLPVDEWPRVPDVDGEPVKLDDEWQAIQAVLHAASTDASRPVLGQVEIAGGYVTAIDSYRLASRTIDDTSLSLLLPADLLATVARVHPDGPVELTVDGRWFQLAAGDTRWAAVLYDGDYVSWRQLIPTVRPATFTVDGAELLEALAAVSALGSDESAVLARFTVEGDTLTITHRRADVGDTAATLDATGDPTSVVFNAGFVASVLRQTAGAVTFEAAEADGLKPWIVLQGRLTQLLMPVRAPQ